MKNLSNEDLKYLGELGKKMNKQDNRSTQFPMFVIKQKVKVYGKEGCCSGVERHPEQDSEEMCDACSKKYEEGIELSDTCDECSDECFLEFNWEDQTVEIAGSFFTAEAAQQHIDLNRYHYNEPFTYGIPSWRNYEMQKILEILSKLGNEGKALSQYN